MNVTDTWLGLDQTELELAVNVSSDVPSDRQLECYIHDISRKLSVGGKS